MPFDDSVGLAGFSIDLGQDDSSPLVFDYGWSVDPYFLTTSPPSVTQVQSLSASFRTFQTTDQDLRTTSAWQLPVRRVYGRQRVRGNVAWFAIWGSRFRVVYEFCDGPCEDIQSIYVDDQELDVSALAAATLHSSGALGRDGEYAFYLGTAVQDVSALSLSGTWTSDSYANYVCVVLDIVLRDYSMRGFPRVEIDVLGRNDIDDPRSSAGYTVTPVLCAAHLIEEMFPGTSFDSTTLTSAANRQETSLGGSQRHTWGMVLGASQRSKEGVLADLEQWCSCYFALDGATWKVIPDEPSSQVSITVHTINDSTLIHRSTIRRVGERDKPDDVRVEFYDRAENKTKYAFAQGNVNGVTTTVSAPYIGDYREAKRLAVRTYNRLRTEDLVGEIDVEGPVALQARRGELVAYTNSRDGISNDWYRITGKRMTSPCRAVLQLQEYLVGTYSNSVQTDPTTYVGDPSDIASEPPTVTGLSGSAVAVGRLARVDLTWDDPDYAWLRRYQVRVYDRDESPDQLLSVEYTTTESISVSGLPADVNFFVEVLAESSGAVGSAASANVDKPTLPTPGNPTDASIDVLSPVLPHGGDAVRCRLTWTDPDYRAWIGYRLKVYFTPGTTLPAGQTADETFEFGQGGAATVDLSAPPGYTEDYDERYIHLKLHAINAVGDESSGVTLQHREWATGGPVDFGRFDQTRDIWENLTDPEDNFTWWDDGDDGNGNHAIRFAINGAGLGLGTFTGAWIDVYSCTSGGVRKALVKSVFMSAGRFWAAADVVYNVGGDADPPYGVSVFDLVLFPGPSVIPHGSESPVRLKVFGGGSDYYRFDIRFAGFGGQETEAGPMSEDADGDGTPAPDSPKNYVLGPI
jgi:hypothetical protein